MRGNVALAGTRQDGLVRPAQLQGNVRETGDFAHIVVYRGVRAACSSVPWSKVKLVG